MNREKKARPRPEPCSIYSDSCRPASGLGRKIRVVLVRLGAMACAALALILGGCGAPERLTELQDYQDFKLQVLKAPQPVLVDFYKGGCPTCVLLNGTMNTLAEEYKGRVTFMRYELMKPYFAVTSEEIKSIYDISFFPTAVLFVNGKETQRWILDYDANKYRKVLNDTLAGKTPETPKAKPPPAKP